MEIPNEVLIWQFGGKSGNLRSENNYKNNQGYNLFCTANNKYLAWKTGMLSINLDFISKPQNKYHLHLPEDKVRDILTGEPIALAIGGGEPFLYYKERDYGINLAWGSSDGLEKIKSKYQWRIYTSSGKKNETIPTGTLCALVNVKVDPDPDFLIYLNKRMPKAVNLGWTTSPNWMNSYLNALKEVNKIRKELI